MKLNNKPRLRSAFKKLYAAKIDWADSYVRGTAAQEAIDFVAMMAGLKPVYVTGRGFDHHGWHATVLELAASNGLYVVAGPYWWSGEPPPGLPEWFADSARERLNQGRSHYVAKARAAAEEIKSLGDAGRTTIDQEARLLGFPVCCVEAHYASADAFESATFEILSRRTGGDETEIRRIVESAEPLQPETDEERQLLATAIQVRPAPYTSLNLCETCATVPDSPGARLSARYREMVDTLTGTPRRGRTGRRRG